MTHSQSSRQYILPKGSTHLKVPGFWPNNTYCDGKPCPHFMVPPYSRQAEEHWHPSQVGYITLEEGDTFVDEDGIKWTVRREK